MIPVRIVWHHVEPSPTVESRIHQQAERLARLCPEALDCLVTVDAPPRHHHHGGLWGVRIDLSVPHGEVLVGGGDHALDHRFEDLHVAVDAAFRALRRRYQDWQRVRRHDVKVHAEPALATVARISKARRHGFLETPDGREIYFHANAVLGSGFRALRPGSRVRFVEEPGEQGPQASTVEPLEGAEVRQ